ncbi:hypothetical protein NUW58_g4018 [Xylaria curta]|uniref:Uncharacterized protein n=1 Tax=Xylaria curta TaxID=42375 RepID=A0ACC1P894_9PEZI|nr:hypothetical protein NUW58_g4018 [Xylaria curta]
MAYYNRTPALWEADLALKALANDPEKLDHARSRFSKPPRSYRSYPSGATTLLHSPNEPPAEQRLLEQEEFEMNERYCDSCPENQYRARVREETERIIQEKGYQKKRAIFSYTCALLAEKKIKQLWIEQRIWDDSWDGFAKWGPWKHEEENNERLRDIPIQEREASRPFYQFVYQLSIARERILERLKDDVSAVTVDSADINTAAYEEVKNDWVMTGLWNKKWGILPGMSWRHEQPFETWLQEEMADYVDFEQTGSYKRNDYVAGVHPGQPDLHSTTMARYIQEAATFKPPDQRELLSVPNSVIINTPVTPTFNRNFSPEHTSPRDPPKNSRPQSTGRNELIEPGSPPQTSPVPPRRSKRLCEAKARRVAEIPASPAKPTTRPKRSNTRATIASQSIPAKDTRVTKRRNIKKKRIQKQL